MSRTHNHRSWTRIFFWAVSGVAFCSQAAASALLPPPSQPATPTTSGWSDLRARLEQAENAPQLNDDLHSVVSAAGNQGRLDEMVRQSYAMANREQIPELDRLWVETLVGMADPEAIQSYMSIRSSLAMPEGESETYYLENWMWKTTVPAGCDGD